MSDFVRPARLRTSLLALAASLLFFACPPRAEAAPPTTVAVGDSITNGAKDEILDQFSDAGWAGGVNAVSGYRIDQLQLYVRFIADHTPGLRRIFFFGGTNDAIQYGLGSFDIEASLLNLSDVVQDLIGDRPKACVFLVTVNEQPNPFGNPYLYAAGAKKLNARMRALDSKHRKVHVIDWNALIKPHDGIPSSEDDWLPDDNIHPNQAGQDALAAYYRFFGSQVSGCGTTLPKRAAARR